MLNESSKFEQCRINQLQEERLYIQKKTFTKWMNSFLQKAKMEVDDIFVDLADGKKLLKLLEIISGEKLGKPNNGTTRVHKVENVHKCLTFLHTKVKLESIGAEDIVDGNKTLILGLLWTIILRFQIQDIEIELEDETDKKVHSSKEALLLWCQRKTNGYPHVRVHDFSHSWRDGMAFNALIHAHRPELIDYGSLDPNDHIKNLNNAFDVAQKHLAIQPLLDSEDVDTAKPDERSVLTYVSSYYHTFAKYNSEVISGKRITNIISQLMEIDRCQLNYELFTTNLLNWIQMKIFVLDKRDFPNNLEGIHNQFVHFKEYRTVEKPPKYKERSEIEALLFNVQTKMKALGQPPYVPPEGKLVQDIQKSWINLEKAEHRRELALREEMIRLEKLNNLAESFFRKSDIRKGYLNEMIQVLSDPRYGVNLNQVEATVRKHEAICVDILSRSERIQALSKMVKELSEGNYYNIKTVETIEKEIKAMWDKMLELLTLHQNNLAVASNVMSTIKDITTIESELNEMKHRISIDQNVPHLHAVEEYLQTRSLMEAQIASHGDTVKRLTNTANKLLADQHSSQSKLVEKELPLLKSGIESLNETYEQLNKLALAKREKLLKLRDFYKILQDLDEEDAALLEKQNICQAILPGKDLLAIISLQQKHNVFEAEVKAHEHRLHKLKKRCNALPDTGAAGQKQIEDRLQVLMNKWQQLNEMTAQKSKELADAIEAFQYHTDANETESWLKEKMQLARSEDFGTDEQSSISLLQRHSRLESEVSAYAHDIDRLNNQSDKMINSGVDNLFLLSMEDPYYFNESPIEEVVKEVVPEEVIQEEVKYVKIPQIVMRYNYNGQKNYSVKKGEILLLLDKTTPEWWQVRRENENVLGYVPANHVQEIEPKLSKVLIRKPVQVQQPQQQQPEKQQLKRFANKINHNRRHSKRRLSIVSGTETVEQRKNRYNLEYQELVELCRIRRHALEDSIKFFRFTSECNVLETWIDNFESTIIKANNVYQEQKGQNSDSVNDLSQQFEKFITGLLANRSRLEEIDKMSKEISLPMYLPVIKKRQDHLHKKWNNLNFLQQQLGKNIEGLNTMETFNAACEDVKERMIDKIEKIDYYQHTGYDLKTVKELQRRHENIERELVPIEDSLQKIIILSENVKSSYPLQKDQVEQRLTMLNQMWEQLKGCSNKKRATLNKMIGLQILNNSSQELLTWMANYVKPLLQFDRKNATAKDLLNLDGLIKEHQDLSAEIKGKSNDVFDLKNLSSQLVTQMSPEEVAMVEQLVQQYDVICRQWQEKEHFLNQCRDLLAFNHEADHLETIINSHLTVLDFDNLGNNINDVSALIRQHETFLNTLLAQDQRVHNFDDFGEKLIQNGHFDAVNIDERRKLIAKRRKHLKEKAYNRNKMLLDARNYHEIKADAEEFLDWCVAKAKLINDNELKDMNNMERKLKRHQAVEAEVRANKSQLEKIQRTINETNKSSHFASKELEKFVLLLEEEWAKLIGLVDNKSKLFTQAFQQIDYIKSLDLIKERLNELDKVVNSTDYGTDRRGCKKLIQQNKAAEKELSLLQARLEQLHGKGQEIAQDHFNADCILDSCDKLSSELALLQSPLNDRKHKLLESNEYYQFVFDANAELQWIKEHLALVSSSDMPQNVTEAQNTIKKFEKNFMREVEGHEVCINKVTQNGQLLVERQHFASDDIVVKIDELNTEWNNLSTLMAKRHQHLKAALTVQQFLADCTDIESWISEKFNMLNNPIYGNDEFTVMKLLQKQKTTDLEIDTYSGLIEELSIQIDKMSKMTANIVVDHNTFKSRVNDLQKQIKRLRKLNQERSLTLIELKKLHEFERESNDFLSWIASQKQALLVEDYGKDFEHCSLLQSKFFDLKRVIWANEERYNQCLEFATSLAKGEQQSQISQKMDLTTDAWNDLFKFVNIKEQNFIAASKIHRFNRDVAEAYERIKDKCTTLDSQDLGRDTHSVQSLIRKHDIFENDLVVLEAQLQVLINDSVKLKAAYPGGNAKNISEQLSIVVNHWEKLKNKSRVYRENLFDSDIHFRFVATIRDIEQWALNLITEMETLEMVRDVQSSQALQKAHERVKTEIESREEEFNAIVQDANNFASKSFYPEVKGLIERLLATRNVLHNSWQRKNVHLDQLIDRNYFLRDVKQLENLCQLQLNRLNSHEFGNTVEEVDATLKKHDEFVKVFESQEAKFANVQDCANKLVQKQHFNSEEIIARLNDLLEKRAKLAAFIVQRRDELGDALILVQFKRDMLETESWIDEKRAQIEKERNSILADDIEAKMKKLQKHQTFEAEINANRARVTEIQDKARHLIKKNHPSSIEIRTQQDNLLLKWNTLLTLSKEMLQGFEEAKDIYEFQQNIAQIESWIRDKEMMIQFADTGEDYEHCHSLLRKLDDVGTDMKVDENRILHINQLANKLAFQCQHESFSEDKVNKQRDSLNENWRQLQEKIADYRNRLVVALEIHSLNRDLDDIHERIVEKDLILSKEFTAKNLAAVESMQRKHDATLVDIFAIEDQFKAIQENDARRLISKYPELTEKSRFKIQTIQESLRKLGQDCKSKENTLNFAISLHKFFVLVKEIETWATDMLTNKLDNVCTSMTVAEAKSDLQNHEYLKAEIAARRENHLNVKNYGLGLLQQIDNVNSKQEHSQIEACIEKIDNLRKKLDTAWEEKHHYLKQCLELRKFHDLCKLCDSWLSAKLAFLANEDLGSNSVSVEELLKKHDTFAKSLLAQQRVSDLAAFSEKLISQKHFDHDAILAKMQDINVRREKLLEMCKLRGKKLADSKIYYQFLRSINEIQRWLNEKTKVATDESYRDSFNLLSKIQKHAAFEAEITANKERVEAVIREGESLINSGHFRSEEIKTHLSNLEKSTRLLNESTTLKRIRLNEAHQSSQFFRLCDDIEQWIKDIESILNEEDRGKDLTSVKNLLKKHLIVENDVHNHNENIEKMKDMLMNFTQSNHFQKEEIEERAQHITQQYNGIQDPLNKRREILEEHLAFFQFKRDIEDELLWIKEKETQLSQFDHGETLHDTQRLLKRLKMFESELSTREPHLGALVSKGHNLIKSSHNNSEDIKVLTYELQNRIQYLKDEASLRKLRLCESLESQQFFSDVAEVESWINERVPFFQSEDIGKDEDSVSTLMKKLEAINKDKDRFYSNSLSKLVQQANAFIEKNHCDSMLIQEKVDALDAHFNFFVQLIEKRREFYLKRKKYFAFERDADELVLWIKDQLIVANSEDYGQDVDHVEKLIQQYETFYSNLLANEERIVALQDKAKSVENCEEKLTHVLTLWSQLKEAAQSRHEALPGAKKVHTFYRSAEETISWIKEKESSTVLDEVNVNHDDLSTIQAKIRELEGFDRDLEAVREQVEALFVEADQLSSQFPDIKEQIDDRKNNVQLVWDGLVKKSHMQKDNLEQFVKIQSYFDEHRDLLTWIKEILALITADEKLGQDVISAEEQLNRHKEYKVEIDARNDSFVSFIADGEQIILQGHMLAGEIEQRNNQIKRLHTLLLETWQKRMTLYEYNVDARQFVQDSEHVEKWIDAHLPLINDNHIGDSLAEVEELILKHDEFEKTIETQGDKLKSIERVTMLEKYFEELLQEEEQNRIKEANQREKERMQQLVQEEQMKILFQRKNEEESRLYENTRFFKQNHTALSKMSPASQQKALNKAPRRSSFTFSRKNNKVKPEMIHNLPVTCEGFLERKQLLQTGGKKATSRSWKNYYTVLCGQLLCFFKDKKDFYYNAAASPPFSIHDARCTEVSDYHKRKYVFSIQLSDMSKFYFAANDATQTRDWLNKISYRASLPPSMQLINNDQQQSSSSSSTQIQKDPAGQISSEQDARSASSSSSSRKSSLSSPSQPSLSTKELTNASETNGHYQYYNQQQQQPGSSHVDNYQRSMVTINESLYPNRVTAAFANGNNSNELEHAEHLDGSFDQHNASSTYQNIPVNKYRSLPPNISPPKADEEVEYDKQVSPSSSTKTFQADNSSLKEKKTKSKKKSFFRRK